MKGLAQANILRSNNTTETGYGIVYANEISGHRQVKTLSDLYALYDWQLSASGDNTNDDAIGQLWYVVNVDSDGTGYLYQLKNWENRHNANGWGKLTTGGDTPTGDYATKEYVQDTCVLKEEKLSDDDVTNIWNSITL